MEVIMKEKKCTKGIVFALVLAVVFGIHVKNVNASEKSVFCY